MKSIMNFIMNLFSLGYSRSGSRAFAWELALGVPVIQQDLVSGYVIILTLKDNTRVRLKMPSSSLLLAESSSPSGERSMISYRADQFSAGELSANEFLQKIYHRAKHQKRHLLGAMIK